MHKRSGEYFWVTAEVISIGFGRVRDGYVNETEVING